LNSSIVGILVDVELGDRDLVAELARYLLKGGGDHPAGAAPLGPEIYENRSIGSEHIGREALVGDGLGGHGGRLSWGKS
jgi:hypothetical protein